MGAALVANEGVDLVHDDRPRRAEHGSAALGRQQQVERLRGRDQDMRRPARHRRTIGRLRIARAHQDSQLGQPGIEGADLRERPLQVLLDVVRERAQRRDIDDLGLVGKLGPLAEEAVDRREESGQGLARAGGSRDEDVFSGPHQRPALTLGRRRLAEAVPEPGADGRMEECVRHVSILPKRSGPPKPLRRAVAGRCARSHWAPEASRPVAAL